MAQVNFFPATVSTPDGVLVGRVYVSDEGRAIVYVDNGGLAVGAVADGVTVEGVAPYSSGVIRLADGTEWQVTPGGVGGCGCSHSAKHQDPAIFGEDINGTLADQLSEALQSA